MKKTANKNEESFLCCNGAQLATKNEKGIWIYKAIPVNSDAFKKGTKVLTKAQHDKPRYKIVNEIEDAFKKEVNLYLSEQTLSVIKTMKNLIK